MDQSTALVERYESSGGLLIIFLSIIIIICALIWSQILLAIVFILILHSIYVPFEDGNYDQIFPVVLGWGIAIHTYLSPGNELAISVIAGIAVYLALTYNRRAM